MPAIHRAILQDPWGFLRIVFQWGRPLLIQVAFNFSCTVQDLIKKKFSTTNKSCRIFFGIFKKNSSGLYCKKKWVKKESDRRNPWRSLNKTDCNVVWNPEADEHPDAERILQDRREVIEGRLNSFNDQFKRVEMGDRWPTFRVKSSANWAINELRVVNDC